MSWPILVFILDLPSADVLLELTSSFITYLFLLFYPGTNIFRVQLLFPHLTASGTINVAHLGQTFVKLVHQDPKDKRRDFADAL